MRVEQSRADLKLLYQLRAQFKRIDQISWTVRDANNRFPLGNSYNEEQLIKIYLALIYDIEDILRELKELKKEYAK